jgi:hypothetical protein
MSKSAVDQLMAIKAEYAKKTESVTSLEINKLSEERRINVAKMYDIPEDLNKRSEEETNLIILADSISHELNQKEGHRRVSVNAQIGKTMDRLRAAGFVHPFKSKAQGNAKLNFLRDDEIVSKYNSAIHGLLNWYSGAGNFIKILGLGMLLRKSCAITLANKHKKSVHWVYSTYGSEIQVPTGPKKNLSLISRHQISNFKRGFKLNMDQYDRTLWQELSTFHGASHSLTFFEGCSVKGCEATENIQVHHIKALQRSTSNKDGTKSFLDIKGKRVSGIPAVLTMLRRKQLPLCSKHHL